jgi:hypothetical protein
MPNKLIQAAAYLLAAGVMLGAPRAAKADFEIRITDSGGQTLTVHDNMAGDLDPLTGSMLILNSTFLGGHLSVLITSGTSQPITPNGPMEAFQDINIQANYDGALGAQSLTVEMSDTNFNLLNPDTGILSSVATNNNTAGITDTFQSWATAGNTEFMHGPVSLGVQSGSSSLSGPASLPQLGQLGSETIISLGAAGSVSIDNSVTVTTTAVPAPAGLVLLLSGSPVLGLGYWLRRRQAPTKSAA